MQLIEKEFLTHLLRTPADRSNAIEFGVADDWFTDFDCREVWRVLRDEKGVLSDEYIAHLGIQWESPPITTEFSLLQQALFKEYLSDKLTKKVQATLLQKVDVLDKIAAIDTAMKEIQTAAATCSNTMSLLDEMPALLEDYFDTTQHPLFPWQVLNKITNGVGKEDLIYIYGHSKSMKTWIWLLCIYNMWYKQRLPIACISFEMSHFTLLRRLTAYHAKINYASLLQKTLSDMELERYKNAMHELLEFRKTVPLSYYKVKNNGVKSLLHIRVLAERLKPRVIYIDALNKLGVKWEEHVKVSQQLKDITRTIAPVIATVQAKVGLKRDKHGKGKEEQATPEDEVGGSVSFIQDCDLLLRTARIDNNLINLTVAASRETPGLSFNLKVNLAYSFEVVDQERGIIEQDRVPMPIDADEGEQADAMD